jgi:ZIP family zinc transporter
MIGEAHEGDTSQLGLIFRTAGFALFGAISVYLGE